MGELLQALEQAYDVKALVSKLKGRGLDIAEEGVKDLVQDVLGWIEDSARLSSSPIDDILVLIIEKSKPSILAEIDKINGKVG
jgi:hypothetical protein